MVKLIPAGQELRAVQQPPAVILGVGQLDTIGCQILGHRQHGLHVVDIVAMQDHIQGERETHGFDHPRACELAVVGPRAGDAIGQQRIGSLDADLHVVQSGRLQLLGAYR